jgi:hypothetical protein
MEAIVIATTKSKCLDVMLASIENYIPINVKLYILTENFIDYKGSHVVHQFPNLETNFGDAYNKIIHIAFGWHDSLVICNDDIVFTPDSWQFLENDKNILKKHNVKLGYLSSRTDYARGFQNIRAKATEKSQLNGIKYSDEHRILATPVISPVCAYIEKKAWIDFMPINFFSDDIQCYDMERKGFKHFISSSYVHHVGSQSLKEYSEEYKTAVNWIEKNRPDFIDVMTNKYGIH